MAEVNHHRSAVDVGDPQIGAFLKPQTAGVDGGETNFVTRQSDATENLAHFRQAEDDRQFLLGRSPHEVEGAPIFVQGALKEELDAANGDGGSGARVMFDVLNI